MSTTIMAIFQYILQMLINTDKQTSQIYKISQFIINFTTKYIF